MVQTLKSTKHNWSQYNKKLVQNRSINFWFEEKLLENWYDTQQNECSKRGRPKTYSDYAMQCCQIIRFVFKQPLRQTKGLINSILDMLKPGPKAPCYTQMNRRLEGLEDFIKKELAQTSAGEVVHILFDSSGLKVYGEGEWKVRKHGYSKRRTWRKLHICIDAVTQKVVSYDLTENDIDDAKTAARMLDIVPESAKIMSGDGAYDDKIIYNKAYEKGMRVIVPPDKNGVINLGKYRDKNHGIVLRNKALIDIQKNMLEKGVAHEAARKEWKIQNNYHQRSKVETSFYRLKTRLGDKVSSREFALQKAEAGIKCYILNKFSA